MELVRLVLSSHIPTGRTPDA